MTLVRKVYNVKLLWKNVAELGGVLSGVTRIAAGHAALCAIQNHEYQRCLFNCL